MTESLHSTNGVRALLLAGGLGTRLRPLTDQMPKCLVPIAGRPLLDYWFDRLAAANVRDVRINTHHHFQQVREYIHRRNAQGYFRVSEAYEPTLLGSAGTVHANRDWARPGDTVLVIYADNLSDVDLSALLAHHHAHGGPVTMMLFRTPAPKRCGIATLDATGRIVEFVEKPAHPNGNLANGGLYALTYPAWCEMADVAGFDLAFDVLPRFVGRMHGWVWEGYHRDIGSLESLEQARHDAGEWRLFATGGGNGISAYPPLGT
jgi:NDP-sugar pyrophosphorylase family protein